MIEGESLPQTIRNQSVVTFHSGTVTSFSYSNIVNTVINGPSIAIVKSSDMAQAGLSLPVTFRIAVSNSGNRAANVTVYDSPPPGTSFVANSVLVNGSPVPGITPGAGIPLGEVNPGAFYTIVFQLILTVVPPSGRIENQARADYEFRTLDDRVINGSVMSNVVSVPVTALAVSLVKSVSSAVTYVGDMITYSVTASNEGSEPLRQCVLLDPLPAGTSFVPGSVTIGGIRNPSVSPNTGIPLGTIEPGAVKQIRFNAVVLDVPVQTRLTNRARLAFHYGQFEQSAESNAVTAIVSGPALDAIISVEPGLATIGDTLKYAVVITNTGSLETSIIARDLIPYGTSYVQGTAALNGRVLPGADPVNGIPLGPLPPGITYTLTFDVIVTRVVLQPLQPAIDNRAVLEYGFRLPDGMAVTDTLATNTVTVRLVLPVIAVHLAVNPQLVEAGGTFYAEVRITNTGNYPADVTLIDFVPDETSLEPGSAYVNGRLTPGDAESGIPVGILSPDETATIAYRLLVDLHPYQYRIRFRVRAAYRFAVHTAYADASVYSNEATVRIESHEE
ncbi:DUF11 domain-containing protein [Paenibacillus sacheonensis]|uniref:DUF11 domain-containing protein n=1 Tax=Paenibacillus sacheonensis TaxID=742054 RepID=A0A7X4YKS2_9BACL|nr:DUF11 domain-containing protein [Paenibacillus sacheonensis]MBM7563210.1 putative repeat protein (TIGR01451 family) [Paenibacillus sacheonensis]NBC68228.1 DUF11 domain-containing protein [Paenibacillus sacheonensis]